MIKLLLVLLFAIAAAAQQDVPLGDVARANRQKAAQPAASAQSSKPAAEKPKRVFTNDDVGAESGPAAVTSGKSMPEAERRKFKKGLTVAQQLRMSDRLRTLRGTVASLEREQRRLRDKAGRSAEEERQFTNLSARIGLMQEQIAKIEASLYE